MSSYRLLVQQQDRHLGHFDAEGAEALQAIHRIAALLRPEDGFQLELLVAHDERRLLESGPEGLRVLSREPLFHPASL